MGIPVGRRGRFIFGFDVLGVGYGGLEAAIDIMGDGREGKGGVVAGGMDAAIDIMGEGREGGEVVVVGTVGGV